MTSKIICYFKTSQFLGIHCWIIQQIFIFIEYTFPPFILFSYLHGSDHIIFTNIPLLVELSFFYFFSFYFLQLKIYHMKYRMTRLALKATASACICTANILIHYYKSLYPCHIRNVSTREREDERRHYLKGNIPYSPPR